jgi:hypothetical protein
MDSLEVSLWVKIVGVFLAIGIIFLLAAWEIVVDRVSDAFRGISGKRHIM